VAGGDLEGGYNAEDFAPKAPRGKPTAARSASPLTRMAVSCYAYDDQSATYKLSMGYLRWAAIPFALLAPAIVFHRLAPLSKREGH